MKKIAVIHASRGRPLMALEAYKEWISFAKDPSRIEYVLCLDDDDEFLVSYEETFRELDVSLCISNSRNVVQAYNAGANSISETIEIIIASADEFGSFQDWDDGLINLFVGIDNFKEMKIAFVFDGLWDPFTQVECLYCANRAYYEYFGHMLYPEYTGVHADKDFTEVAKKLGCIIDARHLLFQHRHYEHPGRGDSTYLRVNRPEEYDFNYKILKSRMARNFDLGDIK